MQTHWIKPPTALITQYNVFLYTMTHEHTNSTNGLPTCISSKSHNSVHLRVKKKKRKKRKRKKWRVSKAVTRSCHNSCTFLPSFMWDSERCCERLTWTVCVGRYLSPAALYFSGKVRPQGADLWIQWENCVGSFEKQHPSTCTDLESVKISNMMQPDLMSIMTLRRILTLLKKILWSALNLWMILADIPQQLLCESIFFAAAAAAAPAWWRTVSII